MKDYFKNFFKISLVALTLVFTISGGDVYAQALQLTFPGNTGTLTVGQKYTLNVATTPVKSGVTVTLQTLDEQKTSTITWISVNPSSQTCTTATSGSCSFEITPTQQGKFNLAITASGHTPSVTGSPLTVFGQALSISANPTSINKGQTSTVTITTPDRKPDVDISFPNHPQVGAVLGVLGSGKCTTGAQGSCTVTFDSSHTVIMNNSQFEIQPARASGYADSNKVTITIGVPGRGNLVTTPLPNIPQGNTGTYQPLAPLPGGGTTIDVSGGPGTLNTYLNLIIKLIIGIAAVLAVVMIVVGGIERMSESVFHKGEGSRKIWGAVLGLLLALGAYAILNTINPDLLSGQVGIPKTQIIFLPDAGDSTVDPAFKTGNATYSRGTSVSSGIQAAVAQLSKGHTISSLEVDTGSRTMKVVLRNGSQIDPTNYSTSIGIGSNGTAPAGQGRTGDKKTPIGTWNIIGVRYAPNSPQFSGTGSNMGAAFWHLNPTSGGERGIGIHGNKAGTLSSTNGCIRLTNADILALQPYIRSGIPVIIK